MSKAEEKKDAWQGELMSSFKVGGQELKNRLALAPLTRAKTDASRLPNELMGTYYEQRASGGLLITEATAVSEQGFGWRNAPGIYTEEMAEGWKKIVDRVHANKGVIYLQLWHMGRQSHSSFHKTNEIVSASALAIEQGETTTANGEKVPFEVPRALRTDEIAGVVEQFRSAAALCKKAGFDGVEIHSANGYLVDQFLQSCSNKREDQYGGSKENRVRLLIEIIEAVSEVYPLNRIACRLSPQGSFGGMGSEDNYDMFTYIAKRLNRYNLAYVHVMDGVGFGFHGKDKKVTCMDIKKHFDGPIMANVGLTRDVAEGLVRSGAADLIAFGRLYISNPDLPERFRNDWPVEPEADYATWWQPDTHAKGYTDWPTYPASQKASK